MEREQKFNDALKHYNVLVVYFRQLKGPENASYTIAVLNNMAGILHGQGQYQQAIQLLKGALQMAVKFDDYDSIGEFYHKLGIIYNQLAKAEEYKKKAKNVVITPSGKIENPEQKVLLDKGVYTRLLQAGEDFVADRIGLTGSVNPFERKEDLYTKIVNLKVKSDFEPDKLLVPDTVEFLIQIRKKGYFTISEPKSLLPEMEYAELNKMMVAIPRKVEPVITEDFYRQGPINPDEITLNPIEKTQTGRQTDSNYRQGKIQTRLLSPRRQKKRLQQHRRATGHLSRRRFLQFLPGN